MKARQILISGIALALFAVLNVKEAKAHCEVPCGIYGDSLRVAYMYEHISTIEKSMIKISELEKAEVKDYNQIVRWVNTKEKHAEELQKIVSQYFLHQRIKIKSFDDPDYATYIKQLTLAHKTLVLTMKTKQSLNKSLISDLRDTLHLFEHAYFGGHAH